jgi:methylmalonyl-CoA carboxyltransferase small subunit
VKFTITVDGKQYEVEVDVHEPVARGPGYLPPVAQQARVPAAASAPAAPAQRPTPGAAVSDESKVCRSPLAGLVSRLAAQVGQTIQVNDVLVVLEAMKMETVITAPVAGKIARINASVGDAVQQGQVLVEFE